MSEYTGIKFLAAVASLRATAEPTRLRLLAVLARAELTVGELCSIVRQSQPRVSRHLKLLCDAGLIDRFREQHWVYYRAPSAGASRAMVQRLLSFVDDHDPTLVRDRERMAHVIEERGRRASDQLAVTAKRGSSEIVELKGSSALVDAIIVNELAGEPIGALLDVGTGAGHLLELLGSKATRAVGIDISSDALRLARTNVHGAGLSHCELQRGDMYDLPFAAPLFDTVTADRVLADAERPVAALAEIVRTLKATGRLLVIEDFDRLAETVGGNPIAKLRAWFDAAGLICERLRPIDAEHGHLLVALARRRRIARPVAA
jgi:DNA-binding transcriptional ArsR family regulator